MRCDYCEWHCDLGPERFGVCRAYHEAGGRIRERFPHAWSSCGVAQIEAVPFYHVAPGSRVLVIGTAGCNFTCRYCSNAFIAKEDPLLAQPSMTVLEPRELIAAARKLGCTSLVFNVNEPTMALQSLAEVSLLARAAGLPMGCLTNAYTSESGTALLAAIFSFFSISLKGLGAGFHRELIGIPDVAPVLRNIRSLARSSHVEVITPVIQGVNDGDLDAIAGFLAEVDREIPWHVFRLLPESEMKDAGYPNIERINRSLESARGLLPYLYFHNFVGSDWVDTHCPECAAKVVERFSLGCGGDQLRRLNGPRGPCPRCGHRIRLLYPELARP